MLQHVIYQGLWPPEAGPRLWPRGLLLWSGGRGLPAAHPPARGAAHPRHGPRHAMSRHDVTQPQPRAPLRHLCQAGGQQGSLHHRPHHPLQQTGGRQTAADTLLIKKRKYNTNFQHFFLFVIKLQAKHYYLDPVRGGARENFWMKGETHTYLDLSTFLM